MAKVNKSTDSSSLAEVVDRILDKGIVIDDWVKVSLVGIELLSMYKAAGNTGIYPFGRPSMVSGQPAKVAVRGSMRMHYERVMAAVLQTSRALESAQL